MIADMNDPPINTTDQNTIPPRKAETRTTQKAKTPKIRESDISGLKYFRKILPLLERLHNAGCQRDKADNRRLHYDQYCCLILLFFFNPIVTSLRGLQQASELKNVQKKLGCPRASLGSLSEATQVFDPELLREIVAELSDRVKPIEHDPRLNRRDRILTAVDGSLLKTLPQIAEASCRSRRSTAPDGWRLHTHFEVTRGIPVRADLTDGRNRGESNEKNMLRNHLQPDRLYVIDRGYEQFALFNAIVDAKSSYICRIQGEHQLYEARPLPLSDEAVDAGVLEDRVGRLGSPKSVRIEHPHHGVRMIRIRAAVHPNRDGATARDIVLVTNLPDVPAEIVALMYRYRWQVELFFRFFKHVLGCRHLLSRSAAGIQIQTYCAIIVCLLIGLCTGRKPTLRTYEMICHYFMGWADEEELLAHIAKLKSPEKT
jgi:hypothetical protein